MFRRKRSKEKPQVVRVGELEIETLGLNQGFWTDLYHRAVTAYWAVFFGSAAALFVALSTVFAFAYSLGREPIANATENGALGLFYFSIETWRRSAMATCTPGPITGIWSPPWKSSPACACRSDDWSGLRPLFAPARRFVFATQVVIAGHEGQQALMIRAANARHDTISRASARLWLVRLERTREGDNLRRFYELNLDRSEHPVSVLSWMLLHVIDTRQARCMVRPMLILQILTPFWCSIVASTTAPPNSFTHGTSIPGAIFAGTIATRT
jgi:inward rectifier potassium channel